eukprot:13152712-Ditylum_brightwellii.AAC.1
MDDNQPFTISKQNFMHILKLKLIEPLHHRVTSKTASTFAIELHTYDHHHQLPATDFGIPCDPEGVRQPAFHYFQAEFNADSEVEVDRAAASLHYFQNSIYFCH